MTKFLYFIIAATISTTVVAQDTNTLFPELQRQNAPTANTDTEPSSSSENQAVIPSLFDTETPEEIKERERQMIREARNSSEDLLAGTLDQADAQQKPITKAEEGFFVFKPSDIQAVIPSIQRFAFCMSQLTLANHTDSVLKELGVVIQYTPIDVPYTFSNLGIEDSQTGTIALAGDACQTLLKVPNVIVKSCKAVRIVEENNQKKEIPLSEAECRSKVKYIMP